MRARTGFGWWVIGMLMGMQALGGDGEAVAEPRLRAGIKELSFAGGFSISHNIQNKPAGLESVTGYDLIPHVGAVLTDEVGSGWVRGNFELLLEPTLVHLDASRSATVGGLALLGRWIFAGGLVRLYLEGGGGALGGKLELRQTTCEVNFILGGGPGVLLFMSESAALTLGYRFQHISNGGKCTPNLGVNSSVVILGVSYFFP